MPGTVIAVPSPGAEVAERQTVAIVEAMKMEHTLLAPFDAVVSEVSAVHGQPVALDEPLADRWPAERAALANEDDPDWQR